MPPGSLRSGCAADKDRRFVTRPSGKGLGTDVNELAGLVIAYAKQETVEPLKGLLRFVAWGTAGALLLLTAVRVVQTETGRHLHGDLTWVPYFAGVLVAAAGVAWAASRIVRRKL